MKKIIVGVLSSIFAFTGVFAYTPMTKDVTVLNILESYVKKMPKEKIQLLKAVIPMALKQQDKESKSYFMLSSLQKILNNEPLNIKVDKEAEKKELERQKKLKEEAEAKAKKEEEAKKSELKKQEELKKEVDLKEKEEKEKQSKSEEIKHNRRAEKEIRYYKKLMINLTDHKSQLEDRLFLNNTSDKSYTFFSAKNTTIKNQLESYMANYLSNVKTLEDTIKGIEADKSKLTNEKSTEILNKFYNAFDNLYKTWETGKKAAENSITSSNFTEWEINLIKDRADIIMDHSILWMDMIDEKIS